MFNAESVFVILMPRSVGYMSLAFRLANGILVVRRSVDSPDCEQGLFGRPHSQSEGRFAIGDIGGAERIKGNCRGNVFAQNLFVNPNAFGHLSRCFG